HPPTGREARRSARTPEAPPRRACALLDRLAAVWARLVGELADRLPSRAGTRGRSPGAGSACAAAVDLRRGPRPQPRAGHLRRGSRLRRRLGRATRRPAHHSAIAAGSTGSYVDSHPEVQASSALAITHGFQIGFCVLTGLLLLGALIAATLLKPRPPTLEA